MFQAPHTPREICFISTLAWEYDRSLDFLSKKQIENALQIDEKEAQALINKALEHEWIVAAPAPFDDCYTVTYIHPLRPIILKFQYLANIVDYHLQLASDNIVNKKDYQYSDQFMDAVILYISWYQALEVTSSTIQISKKENGKKGHRYETPSVVKFDRFTHLIKNLHTARSFRYSKPIVKADSGYMFDEHVGIGDIVQEKSTKRDGMVIGTNSGTVNVLLHDKYIVSFASGSNHLLFIRHARNCKHTSVEKHVLEQIRLNPCCDLKSLSLTPTEEEKHKEEKNDIKQGTLVLVNFENKPINGVLVFKDETCFHVLDNMNVVHKLPLSLDYEVRGSYCKPNNNIVGQKNGERTCLKIRDSVRVLSTKESGIVRFLYPNGWMVLELDNGVFLRTRYGVKYIEIL